jgi:hypothetical protein
MLYSEIQKYIDKGLGFASKVLGPPHNVYRPTSQDDEGNLLIESNLISSNYPVFSKIAYGGGVRESFESEKNQGIMFYRIIADMSPFLVGDIFINADPVYGEGSSGANFANDQFKGFALADHSPIKKALGGRLNCCVNILRPAATTNQKSQYDRTKQNMVPVVLADGVFSLGTVGQTPANIPAGLIAQGRSYGDKAFSAVPAEQRKSGWEVYVPALNGFDIREGDKIIGPDGSRYVVIIPFTQFVGATGGQWFCEREASGQ